MASNFLYRIGKQGLCCIIDGMLTNTSSKRLIAQLNDKDKGTVMNIIETMLTKQKFQNFFEQNIAQ